MLELLPKKCLSRVDKFQKSDNVQKVAIFSNFWKDRFCYISC